MRFDRYVPAVKSGGFGDRMMASKIKNSFQKGSGDDSVEFVFVDRGIEALVTSVIVKSYSTMNLRFCAFVFFHIDRSIYLQYGLDVLAVRYYCIFPWLWPGIHISV